MKSNFRIMQFTEYYWGDEVKEDEMVDKCNGDEGGDKCLQNFIRNLEGRMPHGDVDLDVCMMFK
jgi:hypothetical protein